MLPFVDRPSERRWHITYSLTCVTCIYPTSTVLIWFCDPQRTGSKWRQVTDSAKGFLNTIENWKKQSRTKARRRVHRRVWNGLCPVCILQEVTWNFFVRQLSTDGACRGDLCHAAGIKVLNLFSSGIWRHLLLHILTQCACACSKILYLGEQTRLTKKYSINKP